MNPTPEPTDRAEVTKLANAVEEALANVVPTSIRVEDPAIPSWQEGPRIGNAAPVAQPGIPAMSARATSNARVFMYCSWATVPPGLIAIGIMVASEHANPTVIGLICAAPAAIAVPILALARLIRRTGEAAPTEIHQTYMGPVHNDTRITQTRAVWSKTNNRH